jgi:hypothetical protein
MAVVETQIDASASLTVHTAHGVMTKKEILTVVDNYYQGTVTKCILWNFVESELNQISTEDVRVLASLTKKYCKARPGGKTALVFARLVDYGIGRMFQILSEMSDENVEFMPFSDLASALEWLRVSHYDGGHVLLPSRHD